jgi:fumarate reductase flavoprotein subunit
MSKNPAPTLVRNQSLPEGTPHVPVVIVGAGACGLTTAIRLRDAGIECVLLERDQVPQGSTALSSGFVPAAGTRLQKSMGIEDSQELFAADVVAKTHGEAAPHLVQAYTRAVAQAIDSLEAHGIVFEVLEGFMYPGHGVLRMHAVPQRTGSALMAALERTAAAAGADILTEALVRELWLDGDRVVGIGYVRPDGGMEHIACDEVVLACNGFGGNQEMVRELLPDMANADFGGHVGNDGSAIAWGRQLGARLADLRAYQGHGSWVVPQGALMTWAVIMEGGVQINAEGRRFHDETHGYSEAAVHVLHQPGRVAWNVFDDPLLALARTFPDFVEAEKAGALRTARNEDELARLIGCDARVLHETLAGIAPDRTDEFGRRFRRALAAPYHAVKVTGALFHTQGGLDIDDECRVLREDGTPMPNLLAAGGAARGVSGNDVAGYLSGNGLLSAVGGGWVAAGTVIGRRKA